jgi:hypothetical protein
LLPSHYGFQLVIVGLDKVLDGLVFPQVVSEPLPEGEVGFLRFDGHLDALRVRCRLNFRLLRIGPLDQRGEMLEISFERLGFRRLERVPKMHSLQVDVDLRDL